MADRLLLGRTNCLGVVQWVRAYLSMPRPVTLLEHLAGRIWCDRGANAFFDITVQDPAQEPPACECPWIGGMTPDGLQTFRHSETYIVCAIGDGGLSGYSDRACDRLEFSYARVRFPGDLPLNTNIGYELKNFSDELWEWTPPIMCCGRWEHCDCQCWWRPFGIRLGRLLRRCSCCFLCSSAYHQVPGGQEQA